MRETSGKAISYARMEWVTEASLKTEMCIAARQSVNFDQTNLILHLVLQSGLCKIKPVYLVVTNWYALAARQKIWRLCEYNENLTIQIKILPNEKDTAVFWQNFFCHDYKVFPATIFLEHVHCPLGCLWSNSPGGTTNRRANEYSGGYYSPSSHSS